MSRFPVLSCLVALSVLLSPSIPHAAKTAFRITDMDWREPHWYVNFLGCRDITDTALAGFSVNGDLQTSIQTDGDTDGNLDLSYLIIFDPLDQASAGGVLTFTAASCDAPAPPSLCLQAGVAVSGAYANGAPVCLEAIAGTTYGPYTPEVTAATSPCFVASLGTVTLAVNGIPMTLMDTYLAATYVGNPATSLVNGLIRGFITESVANNTILPASMALVGGMPLSSLFPGGDPPGDGNTNCASHSDKDTGPGGVTGWYVYFNFTASAVQIPTAVDDAMTPGLVLEAPRPNPFNPSTSLRYTLPNATRVRLSIHDASGREIAVLADGEQVRGDHVATWNGRDTKGVIASSGVYFARLDAGAESRTRKLVLLK